MNRKNFIKRTIGVAGLVAISPLNSKVYAQDEQPIFELEEIRELVFAAHKSLDETKKILEAKPILLNCANQAKKGDFETAMGGASHMGRKDIADYLLSKGARLDIFNSTFLGYNDFVKKIVTDHPNLLRSPGPHGFTLLHHAQVGKQNRMVEWLKSQGLEETHIKGLFG